MLGRLLSSVALVLLIGSVSPAGAENLEAGKSPSQIFAGTCTACHKGARGLVRTVAPGSLPSFLRQHYTTSSDMASLLAGYLLSNGGSDARYRQNDAKTEPKEQRAGSRAAPEAPQAEEPRGRRKRHDSGEAAQSDAEQQQPTTETRRGRHGRRMQQPDDSAPAEAAPATEEGAAVAQHERSGSKSRQKHGRKGRHNTEPEPSRNAGKGGPEPAKPEAPTSDRAPETPVQQTSRPEPSSVLPSRAGPEPARPSSSDSSASEPDAAKPASSQAARPDSGDVPTRADPVPAVTPAPREQPRDMSRDSSGAGEGSRNSDSAPAGRPAAGGSASSSRPAPATSSSGSDDDEASPAVPISK